MFIRGLFFRFDYVKLMYTLRRRDLSPDPEGLPYPNFASLCNRKKEKKSW